MLGVGGHPRIGHPCLLGGLPGDLDRPREPCDPGGGKASLDRDQQLTDPGLGRIVPLRFGNQINLAAAEPLRGDPRDKPTRCQMLSRERGSS